MQDRHGLAKARDGGHAETVYEGGNNTLGLLELLTGLVLDAVEALVLTAARRRSNGMSLGVIILGEPASSSKPSKGLLYLVVRVSPEDWPWKPNGMAVVLTQEPAIGV
jgi:hypothetical protein